MQAANHQHLSLVQFQRADSQAAFDFAGKAQALGFHDRSPDLRMPSLIPPLIGLRRFDQARAQTDRMEHNAKLPLAMATVGRIRVGVAEDDAATVDA